MVFTGQDEETLSLGSRKRKSNRRSSILKRSPSRNVLCDLDPNTQKPEEETITTKRSRDSRRVSFAETYEVKEFMKDPSLLSAWQAIEDPAAQANVSAVAPNIAGLQSLLTGPIQDRLQVAGATDGGYDPDVDIGSNVTTIESETMEMTGCYGGANGEQDVWAALERGAAVNNDYNVLELQSSHVGSTSTSTSTATSQSPPKIFIPSKQFSKPTLSDYSAATEPADYDTMLNTSLNKYVSRPSIIDNPPAITTVVCGGVAASQTLVLSGSSDQMGLTTCHGGFAADRSIRTGNKANMTYSAWDNTTTKVYSGGGGTQDGHPDRTMMFNTTSDGANMEFTAAYDNSFRIFEDGSEIRLRSAGHAAGADRTKIFNSEADDYMEFTNIQNTAAMVTTSSGTVSHTAESPAVKINTKSFLQSLMQDGDGNVGACFDAFSPEVESPADKVNTKSFLQSMFGAPGDDEPCSNVFPSSAVDSPATKVDSHSFLQSLTSKDTQQRQSSASYADSPLSKLGSRDFLGSRVSGNPPGCDNVADSPLTNGDGKSFLSQLSKAKKTSGTSREAFGSTGSDMELTVCLPNPSADAGFSKPPLSAGQSSSRSDANRTQLFPGSMGADMDFTCVQNQTTAPEMAATQGDKTVLFRDGGNTATMDLTCVAREEGKAKPAFLGDKTSMSNDMEFTCVQSQVLPSAHLQKADPRGDSTVVFRGAKSEDMDFTCVQNDTLGPDNNGVKTTISEAEVGSCNTDRSCGAGNPTNTALSTSPDKTVMFGSKSDDMGQSRTIAGGHLNRTQPPGDKTVVFREGRSDDMEFTCVQSTTPSGRDLDKTQPPGDKTVMFREGKSDDMEFTCVQSKTIAGADIDKTQDKTVVFREGRSDDMEFTCVQSTTLSGRDLDKTQPPGDKTVMFREGKSDDMEFTCVQSKTIAGADIDKTQDKTVVFREGRSDDMEFTCVQSTAPSGRDLDKTQPPGDKTVVFREGKSDDMEFTCVQSKTIAGTDIERTHLPGDKTVIFREGKSDDMEFTCVQSRTIAGADIDKTQDKTVVFREGRSDDMEFTCVQSTTPSGRDLDKTQPPGDKTVVFREGKSDDMEFTCVQSKTIAGADFERKHLPGDKTVMFHEGKSDDMEFTCVQSRTIAGTDIDKTHLPGDKTVMFREGKSDDMEFTCVQSKTIPGADIERTHLPGDKTVMFREGKSDDMEFTCVQSSTLSGKDLNKTQLSGDKTVMVDAGKTGVLDLPALGSQGSAISSTQDTTRQERTVCFAVTDIGSSPNETTSGSRDEDQLLDKRCALGNKTVLFDGRKSADMDFTTCVSDTRVEADEAGGSLNAVSGGGPAGPLQSDKTIVFSGVQADDMEFTCVQPVRTSEEGPDRSQSSSSSSAVDTLLVEQTASVLEQTSTTSSASQVEVTHIKRTELEMTITHTHKSAASQPEITPLDKLAGDDESVQLWMNVVTDTKSQGPDSQQVGSAVPDAKPDKRTSAVTSQSESARDILVDSVYEDQSQEKISEDQADEPAPALGQKTAAQTNEGEQAGHSVAASLMAEVEEAMKWQDSEQFRRPSEQFGSPMATTAGATAEQLLGQGPEQMDRQRVTPAPVSCRDTDMMSRADEQKPELDDDKELPLDVPEAEMLELPRIRHSSVAGSLASSEVSLVEEETLELVNNSLDSQPAQQGDQHEAEAGSVQHWWNGRDEGKLLHQSSHTHARGDGETHLSQAVCSDVLSPGTDKPDVALEPPSQKPGDGQVQSSCDVSARDRSVAGHGWSQRKSSCSSTLHPRLTLGSSVSQISIMEDISDLSLFPDGGPKTVDDYLQMMGIYEDIPKSRRSTIAAMSFQPAETVGDILELGAVHLQRESYHWAVQQMQQRVQQCHDRNEELSQRLTSNPPQIFKSAGESFSESCLKLQALSACCKKRSKKAFKEWRSKMLVGLTKSLKEEEACLQAGVQELQEELPNIHTSLAALRSVSADLDGLAERLRLKTDKLNEAQARLQEHSEMPVESDAEQPDLLQKHQQLLRRREHMMAALEERKAALLSVQSSDSEGDLQDQLARLTEALGVEVKHWEPDRSLMLVFLEGAVALTLCLGEEMPGGLPFMDKPCRKVDNIDIKSCIDQDESSAIGCLAVRQLLGSMDGQNILTDCLDTSDIPKVMQQTLRLAHRAQCLLVDMDYIAVTHKVDVDLEEYRLHVTFSSLKAHAKFRLTFQVGPAVSEEPWELLVRIGDIKDADIADALKGVARGLHYIRDAVDAVDALLGHRISPQYQLLLNRRR